jgi:hypothetical protein
MVNPVAQKLADNIWATSEHHMPAYKISRSQ